MQIKPIIWHIIFWSTIMILGTATVYPYYRDIELAIINRAIFLPVWLIATYLNWYGLMPRFLSIGQISAYVIRLFVLLLGLTILQRYVCVQWLFPIFFDHEIPKHIWSDIFAPGAFIQFAAFIALPVFLSIGIHYLIQWYRESYHAKQIIAQQKTAELNYLKAQINPHFLFNTLNNLYGLSLEESKKVPDMILKLSDILSYSLYESSAEKIPLYKELKMIKDFIALEKERYEDRMEVTFNQAKELDEQIEIAPLLLIPLVENAFKHGVKEAIEIVPILIDLKIENQYLVFEISNKMATQFDITELNVAQNKNKGLGLKNLRRRLDLMYPKKHSFDTTIEGNIFCAKLKISLHE